MTEDDGYEDEAWKDEVDQYKKGTKKKIQISVNRDPEIESLRDEITTLKTELQTQALKAFESQKDILRKTYPREADLIRNVEVNELKTLKGMLKRRYPKRKAQGKPTFIMPEHSEQYESPTHMVNDLYDRAHYKKEDYTVKEQKEAQRKIDTLIGTLIASDSWGQMKMEGLVACAIPVACGPPASTPPV